MTAIISLNLPHPKDETYFWGLDFLSLRPLPKEYAAKWISVHFLMRSSSDWRLWAFCMQCSPLGQLVRPTFCAHLRTLLFKLLGFAALPVKPKAIDARPWQVHLFRYSGRNCNELHTWPQPLHSPK